MTLPFRSASRCRPCLNCVPLQLGCAREASPKAAPVYPCTRIPAVLEAELYQPDMEMPHDARTSFHGAVLRWSTQTVLEDTQLLQKKVGAHAAASLLCTRKARSMLRLGMCWGRGPGHGTCFARRGHSGDRLGTPTYLAALCTRQGVMSRCLPSACPTHCTGCAGCAHACRWSPYRLASLQGPRASCCGGACSSGQ